MNSSIKIRRFTSVQRLFHLSLIVLFMLLSVTGIGVMFSGTIWGDGLNALFGGYQGSLQFHRITGLLMLAGFAAHIVYLVALIDWRNWRRSIFGPDSLVWLWRDTTDFVKHLGWVFGLCRAPRFERWSWWEKFDYWAVWWGLIIVGITGLMLYDPLLSSEYLPGWMFNVALWVHRIEAILAMGHIFTVHFFVEHFRPHNFPFSATMFDGGMTREMIAEEHPEWLERMEREGRIQQQQMDAIPVPLRIVYFGFGYLMIGFGIYLLLFTLTNISLLTFYGV